MSNTRRRLIEIDVLKAFAIAAILLILVRGCWSILDPRIFLHYPIFIAGILANRVGILSARRIGIKITLAAALICISSYVAFKVMFLRPVNNEYCGNWLQGCRLSVGLILTMIASGVIAGLGVSSWLCTRTSSTIQGLILFLSTGSYAVYLFHRPIFASTAWAIRQLTTWGDHVKIVIFPLLTVLIFFIGYGIQRMERRITRAISTRARPL